MNSIVSNTVNSSGLEDICDPKYDPYQNRAPVLRCFLGMKNTIDGKPIRKNAFISFVYFISAIGFVASMIFSFYEQYSKTVLFTNFSLNIGQHILKLNDLLLLICGCLFAVVCLVSFFHTVTRIENIKVKILCRGESFLSNITSGLYFFGGITVVVSLMLMIFRKISGFEIGKENDYANPLGAEKVLLYVALFLLICALFLSVTTFIEPELTISRHSDYRVFNENPTAKKIEERIKYKKEKKNKLTPKQLHDAAHDIESHVDTAQILEQEHDISESYDPHYPSSIVSTQGDGFLPVSIADDQLRMHH